MNNNSKICFLLGVECELKDDTFEVSFLNSYSPQLTSRLKEYYDMISEKYSNGMEIIGG